MTVPTCWRAMDDRSCACCDDNIPKIEELQAHVERLEAVICGQRAQSQAALTDQLESLYRLANCWGYYDAADFIRRALDNRRDT